LSLSKGSAKCIPTLIAKQRQTKNIVMANNEHATTGEFLGLSFSMPSVSYQMEIGD
jgi:hypothetical protein